VFTSRSGFQIVQPAQTVLRTNADGTLCDSAISLTGGTDAASVSVTNSSPECDWSISKLTVNGQEMATPNKIPYALFAGVPAGQSETRLVVVTLSTSEGQTGTASLNLTYTAPEVERVLVNGGAALSTITIMGVTVETLEGGPFIVSASAAVVGEATAPRLSTEILLIPGVSPMDLVTSMVPKSLQPLAFEFDLDPALNGAFTHQVELANKTNGKARVQVAGLGRRVYTHQWPNEGAPRCYCTCRLAGANLAYQPATTVGIFFQDYPQEVSWPGPGAPPENYCSTQFGGQFCLGYPDGRSIGVLGEFSCPGPVSFPPMPPAEE